MSRLRDKLRVASPSRCNTQLDGLHVATIDATGNATPQLDVGVSELPVEVFAFAEAVADAQEGDSQARRQRCWQIFQRNAQRLLSAPRGQQEALLAIYRTEAGHRYGESMGAAMANTLRSWIQSKGQGLH